MNADSIASGNLNQTPQDALAKPPSPERDTPTVVSANQSQRRWAWWWLGLAVLPLGAIAVPILLPSPATETETVAALPVETTIATAVDAYTTERSYTGEITARRSSQLGFESPGTVIALLVDEGERVQVGQPLARLDTRSLEAQRQQLLAQKAQAQAQLQELQAGPRQEDIAAAQAAMADLEQQVALAQIQRQRREELYARGAISREELDQQTFGTGSLESRLDQARSQLQELQAGTRQEQITAQAARVQQLEASLQALQVDLDKSVLTAPFSGTVSDRSVDEGVVVGGGQPVFTLIEGGSLEARIGVPTEVADGLTVDRQQTVRVDSKSYTATITALLPELDTTSRTVTVVLTLPETANPVVGQTAQLAVAETQSTEGIWLPTTALVPGEQGLWSAYVAMADDANPDGQVVGRREVEILHTDGERVLVRGTVQPGDRVIMSGTHRIVPGQAITVLD